MSIHHIRATFIEPDGQGSVTLELIDGTAAGGAWLVFEIVGSSHQHLVGRTICCSADYAVNKEGYDCHYVAGREWDDGFVSNASCDDTSLPYTRLGARDGPGTGMGGEVLPELHSIQFFCPLEAERELLWSHDG